MKTIKDLSDSIGISKVSIYKAIKRDDIKKHVFKRDNTTLIDEIGETLLINLFNREKAETVDDIVEGILSDSKVDSKADEQVKNADIITLLQEQLKEKDNQINALLNIVANSQKLQATQFLTDNQIVNAPDKPDKPKKSFFDKLFKK